jgi:hypothetical protein
MCLHPSVACMTCIATTLPFLIGNPDAYARPHDVITTAILWKRKRTADCNRCCSTVRIHWQPIWRRRCMKGKLCRSCAYLIYPGPLNCQLCIVFRKQPFLVQSVHAIIHVKPSNRRNMAGESCGGKSETIKCVLCTNYVTFGVLIETLALHGSSERRP